MAPPIDIDIKIHEGNEGPIKITTNRFSGRQTRHVDVKHHVVRDAIDGKIVRVGYVKSREQHADVITKALDSKTLEKHAKFLMNVE